MKKLFLVLALAFISFASIEVFGSSFEISLIPNQIQSFNSVESFFTSESFSSDSSGMSHLSVQSNKKSPTAALLLALVPGSVVHGAGHFYAGKVKTGFILLGTEIVGMSLLMGGALSALPGNVKENRGEMMGFIGFSLFLGSWIYDIVQSPSEVKKHNEGLQRKTNLNFKIEYHENTQELRLLLTKGF
jgi:TM2 domain-containing membrane protein YozV